MSYQHIVFDIDGTLIDTEAAILSSLQQTLAQLQQKPVEVKDIRFVLGIPGEKALEKLGIEEIQIGNKCWDENFQKQMNLITVFDGIERVLKTLKDQAYTLGIITSKTQEEYKHDFVSFDLSEYFDYVICADDSVRHKPDPEPMTVYLKRSGAKKEEVLYIGDSLYDMQCADAAGVACALALWGCHVIEHIKATYYLNQPDDILNLLDRKMNQIEEVQPWLSWAVELQFIAQAGLTYSKDNFDIERFERVREIAAQMLSVKTGLSLEHVKNVFCNETGFQTPKLDTRAVIIENDKILLVKETNGTWSLPGGWVDVNQSIKSNIIKEVKEEAGLDVMPLKLIAVQDRNKHNSPIYAYGVCKMFILCRVLGGQFEKNIETVASDFFARDELPKLATEKNNESQIRMCFEAYQTKNWEVIFD